jgi:hypothetical protein
MPAWLNRGFTLEQSRIFADNEGYEFYHSPFSGGNPSGFRYYPGDVHHGPRQG